MSNSFTAITADNHPIITYKNVRVTTTDLLSRFYGTDVKNIQMNFTRNQARFIAEKHYFKLEGDDLRQFKELHRPTDSGSVQISPKINALMLWTERGAARHAKILDTDAAWDVFELLEDKYFKQDKSQPINPAIPQDLPTALRLYADQLEANVKLTNQLVEMKPKADFYDHVVFQEKAYNFTELFGILKHEVGQTFTKKTFLEFLRRYGIACQPNPYIPVGKDQFRPRVDYLNTWFVAEPTPAGGVEWLIKPLAVSHLVRLILDDEVFERDVKMLKQIH